MVGQPKTLYRKQYDIAVRLLLFVFLPLKGKQEKKVTQLSLRLSGE